MAEETDTLGEQSDSSGRRSTGINASEDAVAWALAHFGADRGLVESLRTETRGGISERLDALPDEESERLLALEAWRERARVEDRIESRVELAGLTADSEVADRWRRRVDVLCSRGPESGPGPSVRAQLAIVRSMVGRAAALEWPDDEEPPGPLGLSLLDAMDEAEMTRSIAAIGIWQLAGIVAGQSRRRTARVRSKLPGEWTDMFQAGLAGNADLAIEAATRIQEVYLGLRRRDFDFEQTTMRLGLFALAAAAGGRFERRLDVWLRRAPASIAGLTRQLRGINTRAMQLRIGPAFRNSLGSFWDYWSRQIDSEDTGNE